MLAVYQDPRSAQSLPADHVWTLVSGDNKSPQLLYRDEAGNECLVPSIWYNQPVQWRIDSFRFSAQQLRSAATRRLGDKDPWAVRQADDLTAQARRLDDLASEMTITGQFPV